MAVAWEVGSPAPEGKGRTPGPRPPRATRPACSEPADSLPAYSVPADSLPAYSVTAASVAERVASRYAVAARVSEAGSATPQRTMWPSALRWTSSEA